MAAVCIGLLSYCFSLQVKAEPTDDYVSGQNYTQQVLYACLTRAAATATPDQTIGELKAQCEGSAEGSIINQRRILEKQVSRNPFAILPHRQNYILPLSYSELHEDIYSSRLIGESLGSTEVEFQISIKYVILEKILNENFDLEFGFTSTSWWQMYSGDISAPFRETNYEPEFIFRYDKDWSIFGLPFKGSYLSLNHQSNGQSGALSRSWNRVITGLTFEHKDIVWSAELWWRIPEDAKSSPDDAEGDDNPNIERYVGQGQIGVLWKSEDNHNLQLQLRNNLRHDNRGSIKLGWSFPFSDRLRGYVQIFNGYGDSLVSYDRHSSRIGIGILLTDWL